LDDSGEFLGVKGGPAHESTIDIWLPHEFSSIRCFD
jgi:hypothetical protein